MPELCLFVPCIVDNMMPRVAEAAVRVLERAGCAVRIPKNQTCCGQPAYKNGYRDEARSMARAFLERFPDELDVVAPTGSCVAMVRRYPELLADEPDLAGKAANLAARTFEFSEYLVQRLGLSDLGAELPGRAVYHDSCQVGRALGLRRPPRELLAAIKGLELVEMETPEQCCGMGGAFSLEFPELSTALLEDKMADILSRKPDYLVTAEPSCMLNLLGYVQKRQLPLQVLHLAEALDSHGASGAKEARA